MKNVFIVIVLVSSLTAIASIEYVASEQKPISGSRVSKSRACFKELELQGCGDPGEDFQNFRSCMNNAYSSLSENCQSLMNRLYGKK